MTTKRILIGGRVQGVGFRYALADMARSRALSGWVRNRRDGCVEAVVCGAPPEVEDAEGEFEGFEIIETG